MSNIRERSMWKKGTIFLVSLMFLMLVPLCTHAKETDRNVTIYGLESSVQEKISIPADLPQNYQIPASDMGNTTYRIISGESARVSAAGLVTPKYTYWKKYPNFSSSVPEGEEYDYYTIKSGDTDIEVKTTDGTYIITVSVKDYKMTYCDAVMDTYIRENITETMTDIEIMEAIARFPASYDYSVSYSSVSSMIIYGGGDCWASTNAITTLCEKLGIEAWERNANKDPGAGSGHMNAMAKLNGVYYELEAGYAMDKVDGYRPYDVTVRDSLFSYSVVSGSLAIYQYDGNETSGVLEVPQQINGRNVERIAKSTFERKNFTEIKLPDTLTEIGDFAFTGCKELTRISIPASVTKIGKSIFANCEKLTELSVAEGNTAYKEAGQVIYSKDGSTLVTCPAAGSVTIPSTVTNIADYAFYYNANLKQIVIPQSVTEMGEGAFGNCEQLLQVSFEGEGLNRIGTHCFRSNSKLSTIKIPASVRSVGAFAFAYCNQLKHIYFMGDAPEFGDTIEERFYDSVFYGCSLNAYYMKNNNTWTQQALENHGGTVTWQLWTGAEGTEENRTDEDRLENNDPVDSKEKKYFDQKTGLTILLDGNGKGEAVLTEAAAEHARGTLKIPDTMNVNGNSYKITSISKNAFKNQKQLQKVILGKYMKTIGEGAFSGCAKLQSVTVGANVTVIENKAFYKCIKLQKITIPEKVNRIGKRAFYGCKNLKNLTIKSKKLTSKNVGSMAFKGIYAKATVKVPKNKLSAYKKMLKTKGISAKMKVKK